MGKGSKSVAKVQWSGQCEKWKCKEVPNEQPKSEREREF